MSDAEFIVDNYRLISCLSTGRYSQVWEAVEALSSHPVAMKLLLAEAFGDSAQRQVIKYEAKVGKALDHPNIVRIMDVTVNKERAFFIMELFKTQNTKVQLLNDLSSVQLRARKFIDLTAQALGHMHQRGWLHKDVKPDNILMNRGAEIRLIDFSLAGKITGTLGRVFQGKKKFVKGTRTYMAPEQIRGKPLSPQTDLYSFGVTIYEVLTGRPPFLSQHPDDLLMQHLRTPAPEPSTFNPNVHPDMDRMVLRMLAKKPENRHENIDELLAEFRNVTIFKEPVTESGTASQKARSESEQNDALANRLDSRTDAMRSETISNTTGTGQRATVPQQRSTSPQQSVSQHSVQRHPTPQHPVPQYPAQQPPVPQQPVPQQPVPQQPVPQQPVQQHQVQPQPVTAQPQQEQTQQQPSEGTKMNIEDLPHFEELPDVL